MCRRVSGWTCSQLDSAAHRAAERQECFTQASRGAQRLLIKSSILLKRAPFSASSRHHLITAHTQDEPRL